MPSPGTSDGWEEQTERSALADLAYNLRWSWHPPAAQVFDALAPELWQAQHNSVPVLRAVQDDAALLARHRDAILAAHADLRRYRARSSRIVDAPRVAYFSAEFAIAECLPIYSGGLGVLAGDHLKAASDLALPLVAIGLLYRFGYFRQVIDATGYQREQYDRLDPDQVPVLPVLRPGTDEPLLVSVPFPGREVYARVWRAQVGAVPLYLLDTDLAENREDDRWITGHLYGGDQDTRIRQEMMLGIGGARLVRTVLPPHQQPQVFHMNEGHAAFLVLELAREQMAAGKAATVTEAMAQLAPGVVFTTHTPVPAGHDAFPSELVEEYFEDYQPQLGETGLSREQFLALGRRDPADEGERFNMTVLAMHGASRRNAVSKLHGEVSREMLDGIGVSTQDLPAAEPMTHVTNGVHTATWVGPEMAGFFDAQLGTAWRLDPDRPENWQRLQSAPAGELWRARTDQRRRLLQFVHARSQAEGQGGLALDVTAEDALVLGFARRFATYKRAALLLTDPERLEEVLGKASGRPLLLVFAGKAHPRDDPGKLLVQRIVQAAQDERFRGRIVFLENYDVAIARLLVQGSDVWLNTPRRPMEASGTSGMKATLNGALHLSELDGWWDEAYMPGIGWPLGEGIDETLIGEARDHAEADQLLDVLQRQVIPLYFERGSTGLPQAWLDWVADSIRQLAPRFSAQRMVREYVERVYLPAAEDARRPVSPLVPAR